MESFNKVLYFILGLVVVLVFIIVFTGRLNLSKNFKPLANISPAPTPKVLPKKGFFSFFGGGQGSTPTPTPTVKPTAIPTPAQTNPGQYMPQPHPNNQKQPVLTGQTKSIPATGSPIEILYLAVPTLSAGLYLRKRS